MVVVDWITDQASLFAVVDLSMFGYACRRRTACEERTFCRLRTRTSDNVFVWTRNAGQEPLTMIEIHICETTRRCRHLLSICQSKGNFSLQ